MYLIGTTKTKFIRNKFFETSFSTNASVNKDDFDKLGSSDLNYLADIFNWDDDKDVLMWIINSAKCDKATALLIFWRSEPDYYTRFENEAEAHHDGEVYKLLRNIIDNFAKGFYKKASIHYNPQEDGHDIHYMDTKSKWQIPDELKKTINGRRVYSMLDILSLVGQVGITIKNKTRRQIMKNKKENNSLKQ